MSKCTWKNCNEDSVTEEKDRNGRIWAKLCQEHHDELDKSLNEFNPKKILSCWVLASGGAKKMAGVKK